MYAAAGMLAGTSPLLSSSVLDKQSIPKNSTLTSIAKEKSLQLIENRIALLQYYKDVHLGHKPWLNSIKISKLHWQQLYTARRGARSFYSMGLSLSTVMDRTYPSLKDYVSAVQTVLLFYDFYDSKKTFIPVEKQRHLPSMTTAHPSGSGSSDSGSNSGSTSPTMSMMKRSKKFSIISSSPKDSGSGHSQQQQSAVDDAQTAFKCAAVPLSSKKSAAYYDSKDKPKRASQPDPSSQFSHNHPLAKNPTALSLLSSLSTQPEEELSYLPDTFEAVMTFLDALIILFYNISYQLRGRKLVFLELNEIEDNLKTIDGILRQCISGEIMTAVINDPHSATASKDYASPAAQTSLCRDADNLEKQILMLIS